MDSAKRRLVWLQEQVSKRNLYVLVCLQSNLACEQLTCNLFNPLTPESD